MAKIINFKCYNCEQKYNIDELKELGYVELIDEYYIVDCPYCGEQTFLKKCGYKSHKID